MKIEERAYIETSGMVVSLQIEAWQDEREDRATSVEDMASVVDEVKAHFEELNEK